MLRTFLAAALLLAGCSAVQDAPLAAAAAASGQLFCALALDGGATATVALITAVAPAINGPAAPTAILAANATSEFVQAACRAAAAATGAKAGIPVAPPAQTVPTVAIVPPATA